MRWSGLHLWVSTMQDWHMSSTPAQSMQWYSASKFPISPQWRQALDEQPPRPSNRWNLARKTSRSESHLVTELICKTVNINRCKKNKNIRILTYVHRCLLGIKSSLRWSRSKGNSDAGSGKTAAFGCLEHGTVTQRMWVDELKFPFDRHL